KVILFAGEAGTEAPSPVPDADAPMVTTAELAKTLFPLGCPVATIPTGTGLVTVVPAQTLPKASAWFASGAAPSPSATTPSASATPAPTTSMADPSAAT